MPLVMSKDGARDSGYAFRGRFTVFASPGSILFTSMPDIGFPGMINPRLVVSGELGASIHSSEVLGAKVCPGPV